MSKPRIQLRLTERQEKLIREKADRLDVSLGEVVRRVLDERFPPNERAAVAAKK
jgi:hypothetical protein